MRRGCRKKLLWRTERFGRAIEIRVASSGVIIVR